MCKYFRFFCRDSPFCGLLPDALLRVHGHGLKYSFFLQIRKIEVSRRSIYLDRSKDSILLSIDSNCLWFLVFYFPVCVW